MAFTYQGAATWRAARRRMKDRDLVLDVRDAGITVRMRDPTYARGTRRKAVTDRRFKRSAEAGSVTRPPALIGTTNGMQVVRGCPASGAGRQR
jgi:hypothetical protein